LEDVNYFVPISVRVVVYLCTYPGDACSSLYPSLVSRVV